MYYACGEILNFLNFSSSNSLWRKDSTRQKFQLQSSHRYHSTEFSEHPQKPLVQIIVLQ